MTIFPKLSTLEYETGIPSDWVWVAGIALFMTWMLWVSIHTTEKGTR